MYNLFRLILVLCLANFAANRSFAAAAAASGAGEGFVDDSVVEVFDMKRVAKNFGLLGVMGGLYEEPKTTDGMKLTLRKIPLTVLGGVSCSPAEILEKLLEQFDYDPEVYSPEMVEAASEIKKYAKKCYNASKKKAIKHITSSKVLDVAKLYMRSKISEFNQLVITSVFFNRIKPIHGSGQHFLERGRLAAANLYSEHLRWDNITSRVADEGLDVLNQDEVLSEFLKGPEEVKGLRYLMIVPVTAELVRFSTFYQASAKYFTDMLTGQATADEVLHFLKEAKEMLKTSGFPELSVSSKDIFLHLSYKLQGYMNGGHMERRLIPGHEAVIIKSGADASMKFMLDHIDRSLDPKDREHNRSLANITWISVPQLSVLTQLGLRCKTTGDLKERKPKKKIGKGKVRRPAKPVITVERKMLGWIRSLHEQLHLEIKGFEDVIRQYQDYERRKALGSLGPKEGGKLHSLRDAIAKLEAEIKEETVGLADADNKNTKAKLAVQTKQEAIRNRKEEAEARKIAEAKSKKDREAEALKVEAAAAEKEELSELERQKKIAEIKEIERKREIAEAKILAERERLQELAEAEELAELAKRQEIAEANAAAALERTVLRGQLAEAYKEKLKEEEAKREAVATPEAASAAASAAASSGVERLRLTPVSEIKDLEVFVRIFRIKQPVDYGDVLKFLNDLEGITVVGDEKTASAKVFFDMPDGSIEMLKFDRPHGGHKTLHETSKPPLKGRLFAMGYTLSHFGLK